MYKKMGAALRRIVEEKTGTKLRRIVEEKTGTKLRRIVEGKTGTKLRRIVEEKTGTKLRRIVEGKTGTKFHDDKPLGGLNHLPESEIGKLRNYYGLTVRRNVNNLEAMKGTLWVIFFKSCQWMRSPMMGFAQMLMQGGVKSRTVQIQDLHINISIVY